MEAPHATARLLAQLPVVVTGLPVSELAVPVASPVVGSMVTELQSSTVIACPG